MGKIRLNTDAEVVRTVQEGLAATGGFCPCRRERLPEQKCVCQEFKIQCAYPDFEGYCHCNLYYKEKQGCIGGYNGIDRPYHYTKAVGEGSIAAHSIPEYLSEQEKSKAN